MDVKKDFGKFFRGLFPQRSSLIIDQMEKRLLQSVTPYVISDMDVMARHIGSSSGMPVSYLTPNIIEENKMDSQVIDVFSRLMMNRIIVFSHEVTSETASVTLAQMLYMDDQSEADIKMYIMSPGGSISAGLGLVDVIGTLKCDVRTINIGMAASMGSILLAAGNIGKRQSLPSARVLIHQPRIMGGGVTGTTDEFIIETRELELYKEKLFRFLAMRSGTPYEKIVEDAKNDYWLSAEESLAYGLIDEVIEVDWSKR